MEVGVKFGAGDGAVFIRGENDQIAIGRDAGVGELPLGGVERIIGEEKAAQVLGRSGGIAQLDPIGMIAVLVGQADGIDGKDFIDGDIRQEQARLQSVDSGP